MKLPLLLLTMLLCGAAHAQSNDSLVVLWLSDPGVRPAGLVLGDGNAIPNASRWDASGDEKPDLVMTREDEQGLLRDILVVTASLDTLWRVQDVSTTLGISPSEEPVIWGFSDTNGDGEREAILSTSSGLQAYNPSTNQLAYMLALPARARFLGVTDYTGDGFEELVVFLPETRQIQVWTWSG